MSTPDDTPDALRNLAGLKILGRIRPLFAHLHDQACRRDRAGNRTLHLDQLASLVMFNPVARRDADRRVAGPVGRRSVSVHEDRDMVEQ